MPDVNVGGNAGSAFTDGNITSPSVAISARVAGNGKRPFNITHLRAYCAGNGAGRTMTLSYAGAFAGFAVGAGASADTGFKPCTAPKYVTDAYSGTAKVAGSGSFNFGRAATSGGSTVTVTTATGSVSTLAGGPIGFGIRYAQCPAAPAAPTVTPAGTGALAVSWATAIDDGDAAVNGYTVQAATNAAFTAGLVTVNAGLTPSAVVSGLSPGVPYWVRVAARNAVTDLASTVGAWSPSVTITTLSGLRVGRAGAWVDASLFVGINDAWVPAAVYAGRAGAWVDLE